MRRFWRCRQRSVIAVWARRQIPHRPARRCCGSLGLVPWRCVSRVLALSGFPISSTFAGPALQHARRRGNLPSMALLFGLVIYSTPAPSAGVFAPVFVRVERPTRGGLCAGLRPVRPVALVVIPSVRVNHPPIPCPPAADHQYLNLPRTPPPGAPPLLSPSANPYLFRFCRPRC